MNLSNILNMRVLGSAVILVVLVLLIGYLMEKNRRGRRGKPGQLLHYTVPGKTAAACRGLLAQKGPDDIFLYTLENASNGIWLHLTQHRATAQPLDTLFLLTFEGDDPARFSLKFAREAFGQPEPIVPEALLDEFFAAKLGACRVVAAEQ